MTGADFTGIASAVAAAISCGILLWTALILKRQVELLGKQIRDSAAAQAETRVFIQNQTTALLAAAKSNGLASRINFYDTQIDRLRNVGGSNTLCQEQEHLGYHLDQVLDKLDVGLNNPAEYSPHNNKVGKWRESP